MPVALRTAHQRAEAKYNVTTEFPSLGLHSAAATGNLGLVEYALEHGQPINSVLDGVLPLHAACAGGNVQVVRLLIDHGADVNAPRLPRRFSNDKNRDSSAPIVGTSGSTPLHFAAANGNTEAVTILLLHGAHADRSDKHGITPEMLARKHGWLECADVLKQWVANKDRDLRERPGGSATDGSKSTALSGNTTRERLGSLGGDADSSQNSWKRLHVKQSIDQALNKFKSSTTDVRLQPPTSSSALLTSTPPASPTKPTGDYVFNPPSSDDSSNTGPRRPSLPFQSPSVGYTRSRKTSTPTMNSSPSPRRPRSAGTGAEGSEQDTNSSLVPSGRPPVRKLGSKYSLMSLFKKAQVCEAGSSPDTPQTPPGSTSALLTSSPPRHPSPLANPLPTADLSSGTSPRHGFRFHRGSDASSRMESITQHVLPRKISATLTPSPRPTAVDMHNTLAQERHDRQRRRQNRDRSRSTGSGARFSGDEASPGSGSSPLTRLDYLRAQGHRRDRSGSGGSLRSSSPGYRGGAVFDDDVVVVPGDSPGESGKSPPRPSILKAHNRTPSSGHSSSAFRALRFDSSSSASAGARREEVESPGIAPGLRGSNSVGSFVAPRRRTEITRTGATPEPRLSEEDLVPDSAPAAITEFNGKNRKVIEDGDDDDEDEDEYGQPLHEGSRMSPNAPRSPPSALLLENQESFLDTSSQSSLSPILPTDAQDSSLISSEFPFSINRPPALENDELEPANYSQDLLRVPNQEGVRSRGDSVSSTSTADSRHNPQLSASGTTNSSGSGSETVTTPGFAERGQEHFVDVAVPSPNQYANLLAPEDTKRVESQSDTRKTSLPTSSTVTPHERRYHIPPDIDISSISSHAQAEALVQKAQQDILEMANSSDLGSGTMSTGRSPLSARLAAYGESLALERKLREQKQEQERRALADGQSKSPVRSAEPSVHNSYMNDTMVLGPRRNGVERQHSLEHRPSRPKSKSGKKDPKRPSTAEGLSPRSSDDQVGRFHQTSHSASGFGISPPSHLNIDHDAASFDDQETVHGHVKSASTLSARRGSSPGPRIVRSRTPLPETSNTSGELSRINSVEGLDSEAELGPPLSRVLTAPHTPTAAARGGKTSTKLARMGFPPLEQIRAQPAANKRFGFENRFKSIFKGKT